MAEHRGGSERRSWKEEGVGTVGEGEGGGPLGFSRRRRHGGQRELGAGGARGRTLSPRREKGGGSSRLDPLTAEGGASSTPDLLVAEGRRGEVGGGTLAGPEQRRRRRVAPELKHVRKPWREGGRELARHGTTPAELELEATDPWREEATEGGSRG